MSVCQNVTSLPEYFTFLPEYQTINAKENKQKHLKLILHMWIVY